MTSPAVQFIRLQAVSSGATKGFILVFHMCSSTPQDLYTHLNITQHGGLIKVEVAGE